MTHKKYRTAQGKVVDLGRLQLKNETTRAVGNMGVNARGDKVDSMNRPIDKKPSQVQRQYNKQISVAPDEIPAPPEDFQDDFTKDSTSTSNP